VMQIKLSPGLATQVPLHQHVVLCCAVLCCWPQAGVVAQAYEPIVVWARPMEQVPRCLPGGLLGPVIGLLAAAAAALVFTITLTLTQQHTCTCTSTCRPCKRPPGPDSQEAPLFPHSLAKGQVHCGCISHRLHCRDWLT